VIFLLILVGFSQAEEKTTETKTLTIKLIPDLEIKFPKETSDEQPIPLPEVGLPEIPTIDLREQALGDYFRSQMCPLIGSEKKIVELTDKYQLGDFRILASIAIEESSCGKNLIAGYYNATGYASGRYKFSSFDECFEKTAETLMNYKAKNLEERLAIWNQGHINKAGINYSQRVLWGMNRIPIEVP